MRNTVKKLIAISLLVIMTFMLTGCGIFDFNSFKSLVSNGDIAKACSLYIEKLADSEKYSAEAITELESYVNTVEESYVTGEMAYTESIDKLKDLKDFSPISALYKSVTDKMTKLDNSNKAYSNGIKLLEDKKYTQSIEELGKVIKDDKNYETALEKLALAEKLYKEEMDSQLNSLIDTGNTKQVYDFLLQMTELFTKDSNYPKLAEEYKAKYDEEIKNAYSVIVKEIVDKYGIPNYKVMNSEPKKYQSYSPEKIGIYLCEMIDLTGDGYKELIMLYNSGVDGEANGEVTSPYILSVYSYTDGSAVKLHEQTSAVLGQGYSSFSIYNLGSSSVIDIGYIKHHSSSLLNWNGTEFIQLIDKPLTEEEKAYIEENGKDGEESLAQAQRYVYLQRGGFTDSEIKNQQCVISLTTAVELTFGASEQDEKRLIDSLTNFGIAIPEPKITVVKKETYSESTSGGTTEGYYENSNSGGSEYSEPEYTAPEPDYNEPDNGNSGGNGIFDGCFGEDIFGEGEATATPSPGLGFE